MAESKEMKNVTEQLCHVKYLEEEHGYVLSFTSLAVVCTHSRLIDLK